MVEAEMQSGRRLYCLTELGRKELAGDPDGVRRIWERAERCGGIRAASRASAERVRQFLDRTQQELDEL